MHSLWAARDEWYSSQWKLQELKRHPKRPDELRIEQLHEPWDEGALNSALQVRGPLGDGFVDFDTSCTVQPPALFNKDPAFEKSIFIPGALADSLAALCTGTGVFRATAPLWTACFLVASSTC